MSIRSCLLDAFFPPICCYCQRIGTLLCEKCYGELEFSNDLSSNKYLYSLSAATTFSEVSSAIVHTLKYQSVKDVALLCARIMYFTMQFPTTNVISAVPLHLHRQANRGFNQAEEIAKELARLLKLEYLPCLERVKETINFAKVNDKNMRALLTKDLFCVRATYQDYLQNKSVLLVDDVWTSSATLTACAMELMDASVTKVHAVTFSHGI